MSPFWGLGQNTYIGVICQFVMKLKMLGMTGTILAHLKFIPIVHTHKSRCALVNVPILVFAFVDPFFSTYIIT